MWAKASFQRFSFELQNKSVNEDFYSNGSEQKTRKVLNWELQNNWSCIQVSKNGTYIAWMKDKRLVFVLFIFQLLILHKWIHWQ